ncbi:ComEC/Rec2 family competence protein [Methanobrevibacter millerae]|uniref:Metal-dependent hydrolase, beta-lactamase superfamily II n=1 Tax=Methanobrevibacter millerae TaxID=230361 RepID=A0A1G5V976_9EURY|nr:MBL fold metallo-hydrolase [Methanobrevibacter millerae]SDA42481.1 Metal-dependent hydrolase, beta-lactamase superfamily II [Methanobrevibacter millerae]
MTLKLRFFDIGHGCSVLIETETVKILFDLGMCENKNPLDYVNGNLYCLIISHPHLDHISGLAEMDDRKPKTILRNKSIPKKLIEESRDSSDNPNAIKAFNQYLKLDKDYNKPTPHEISITNTDYNGGVTFTSFKPEHEANDLNYYSLTVFMEHEGVKVLLMGDNTLSNIEELLANDEFKKHTEDIDIFLAPHHGRESCYSVELMNHLKPKITIISDGSDDSDNSAVDRYNSKSKGRTIIEKGKPKLRKCLTTRNDGDIFVEIKDGDSVIKC